VNPWEAALNEVRADWEGYEPQEIASHSRVYEFDPVVIEIIQSDEQMTEDALDEVEDFKNELSSVVDAMRNTFRGSKWQRDGYKYVGQSVVSIVTNLRDRLNYIATKGQAQPSRPYGSSYDPDEFWRKRYDATLKKRAQDREESGDDMGIDRSEFEG
jgi:hypothetical protein